VSGTNVVVFDPVAWAASYPELAGSVSSDQATAYFAMAGLYVDNSACSPILDLTIRATILNMVVSHIATLLAPIDGQAPSPLVGRISNAAEGSVNVAVDFPTTPNSAWWLQTKYGAMAWTAMAPWRTAKYLANPYTPTSYPWGPFPMPFNGGFPWPGR